MASARIKGLKRLELILQRLPIDIVKTAPGARSEHFWTELKLEWNASLDRQALVLFRIELNYK